MKRIFLDALKHASKLPLLRVWQKGDFSFLFNLPGFRGIAVRILKTVPSQMKVFVLNHPYSPTEFLSFGNWDNPGTTEEFTFPEGGKGKVFIIPVKLGNTCLGEMAILTDFSDPATQYSDWDIFCNQFAALIGHRLFPDYRHKASSIENFTPNLLNYLIIDIHKLNERISSTYSPKANFQSDPWFDEDSEYLSSLMAGFQTKFDLDTLFVIQYSLKNEIHVVISSWVDNIKDLHPKTTEFIEDLLTYGREDSLITNNDFSPVNASLESARHTSHPDSEHYVTLSECRCRIYKNSPLPEGSLSNEPFSQSYQCKLGNVLHGHIGIVNHKNTDLSYLDRLLALLANQLAFRFAYLKQLRKESLNTDILRKINQSSNLLTASIDVVGIIDHLVSSLGDLFGQKSGAILVYHPDQKTPESIRIFGPIPPDFDPLVAANTPGDVYNAIHGSSAFQRLPDDNKELFNIVLPFAATSRLEIQNLQLNSPSLGCLILFNHPENKYLPQDEVNMLTILLNSVSAALLVALNYQEKLETIKSLEGMIKKINNKDLLLTEMINVVRKLLKINRCSFLTLSSDQKYLMIERSYGLSEKIISETKIPIGDEISGYVARTGVSIRIDNIEEDPQFQKRSMEAYFNRSLLSVPLISRIDERNKKVIGVINVNNKISGLTFTDQDQKLLEAMADLVVVALENLEAMDARRQSERIQQQLNDAREVQAALLPNSWEGIPENLSVFGKSIPAKEIGGDFFDFLKIVEGKYLAAIGDVSGKGMPAAILMARIKTFLQLVAREYYQPSRILQRINQMINIDPYHFVTMQIAVIDTEQKTMTTSSAGHGGLLACVNGKPTELFSGKGLPIGIHPVDLNFEEQMVSFNPGDSILMVTDGIYEERTYSGEMYGSERFQKFFSENCTCHPNLLVENLFNVLNSWRGEREAHDDTTVLALKFLK
ncbi:MAG: SpoIIE family protein phosphatase [Candidatus Riflebacteria bacterium]|nr:SpoIIE family protein phosphatase [Candidatus Riflebacteria bacterium]